MARPTKSGLERLRLVLRSRGPTPSPELASALGVSTPTISRMLSRLGDERIRIGRARATRHALARDVRQHGSRWEIFEILPTGRARTWGELRAAHGGFVLEWPDFAPAWLQRVDPEALFGGLPFFLSDARPQGFVGRLVARNVADQLRVPLDPTDWSDDDALIYFATHGDDLPGAFVIGEAMLERALQSWPPAAVNTIPVDARSSEYERWSQRAMAGDPAGSSAGGEQPKFACFVLDAPNQYRAVLVKFSPRRSTPPGRRWSDLLRAEAAALGLLRSKGIPAAEARIIEGDERTFLEITRFDRTDSGGRVGIVSLLAIDAALGGSAPPNWPAVARELETSRIVDATTARLLRRLACFGDLIGNTDMHLGNFGFWLKASDTAQAAPVYDMLPMYLAPNQQGEVVSRPFRPRAPSPRTQEEWTAAAAWALEFWRNLANDETLSTDFRDQATVAEEAVAHLRDRHG